MDLKIRKNNASFTNQGYFESYTAKKRNACLERFFRKSPSHLSIHQNREKHKYFKKKSSLSSLTSQGCSFYFMHSQTFQLHSQLNNYLRGSLKKTTFLAPAFSRRNPLFIPSQEQGKPRSALLAFFHLLDERFTCTENLNSRSISTTKEDDAENNTYNNILYT